MRVPLGVAAAVAAWGLAGGARGEAPADPATCLAAAARAQVGVTVGYDPAYRRIAYPNGDLPEDRGVCTDVLIRAYRRLGVDLQRLVHEDMTAAWAAYPKLWGLARPDPNIDHRRVPNLEAFFRRHGEALPVTPELRSYRAGEIVVWRLPSGVPHVGVLSDRAGPSGWPLAIHNIGRGAREEDVLAAFPITGRYRYLPPAAAASCAERRP